MKHLPLVLRMVLVAVIVDVIFLAVFLVIAVHAAESVLDVPSQNQILACQADARRLCGAYLLGPIEVVRACMLAHKPQLGQQCREAIK